MIWIHTTMVALAASLFILQHVQGVLKSPPSDRCLMEFNSPVKYKISCRYGLKACSNQALEMQFPALYNKSVWRAPAPASVSPEAFCREDPDVGTSLPAISVTWGLPNDQGASLIKGFEIRPEGQQRGYRCIVIELEETVNTSWVSFSGIMTSIEQNKKYVITLQSLPRRNVTGTLDVDVTTPDCASNISGNWGVSEANITYDHVTETLHVAFKGPPQMFGFDEFTLELLRSVDYTVIEKVRINKTQHTFNNIDPGEYVITVQPYDTYFQQDGHCKCKNKRNVCSSCTLSQMKYVAKPKLLAVAAPPETKKTILVAGVTIGILVLALVVIAIIACPEGSRLLIVFINTTEESKIASQQISQAIEHYKRKLRNEPIAYVCENTQALNSKLVPALKQLTEKYSRAYGHTDLQDERKHFSAENGYIRANNDIALENGISIVCCLVVSSCTTKEDFEQTKKVTESLKDKYKVIHVALDLSKDEQENKQEIWEDMKSFRVPTEHEQFLKYITSECLNSDTVSHASKPSINSTSGANSTVSGCSGNIMNDTETHLSQTSRAELLFRLDVPCRPSRERYVSNDSGKGGSVESCKYSPLEDNLDASDETENDYFLHEAYSQPFGNVSGMRNCDVKTPLRCPSDIYFAPPEPSEVSESDILENYRNNYTNVPNGYVPMFNMKHARMADDAAPHCGSYGLIEQERVRKSGSVAKSDDNSSMDMIMSKMAAINARSLYVMDDERKSGETYSVFEGNA